MNKLFIAQILVLLIASSYADDILNQEQPYNIRHEYQGNSDTITQFYIHPNNDFPLKSDNYWGQLANLSKDIELSNDQFVDISYGVTVEAANKKGHIVTGLTIDGVSKNEFVRISGDKQYLDTSARNKVYLTAGTHKITVLYRTPHRMLNAVTDWRWAYLKIIYGL